jgi:hypothetical protein
MLDAGAVEPETKRPDRLHSVRPGAECAATAKRADAKRINTAGEAVLVPEKPPGRALNIRQAGLAPEIEKLLARVQHELQLRQQHIGVEPHAAVERHQVAVDIVNDLDLRPRLGQENRQTTCERLAVADVLRYQRQDPLQEPAFTTRPADRRPHAQDLALVQREILMPPLGRMKRHCNPGVTKTPTEALRLIASAVLTAGISFTLKTWICEWQAARVR